MNMKDKKQLNGKLDSFLDEDNMECTGEQCVIKGDKSLVEVVKKKRLIIEDGRELING